MVSAPDPPLSREEKEFIAFLVNALMRRDLKIIATIEKASLYNHETFLEWLDIVDLEEGETQRNLFSNLVLLKTGKKLGYDLLQVGLGGPGGSNGPNPYACRAILTLARDPKGGNLRLNSIGDVEPEDFG